MKNAILLVALVSFFLTPSWASISSKMEYSNSTAAKTKSPGILNNQVLTAEDVLNGDRHDIEFKLGRKLSFKERIVLGVAKHQLKKAAKRGKLDEAWKQASDDSGSDLAIGLALGILLGLIGVIVAYIIGRKNIIKGSWYGILVLLALILIITVIAASKVK